MLDKIQYLDTLLEYLVLETLVEIGQINWKLYPDVVFLTTLALGAMYSNIDELTWITDWRISFVLRSVRLLGKFLLDNILNVIFLTFLFIGLDTRRGRTKEDW